MSLWFSKNKSGHLLIPLVVFQTCMTDLCGTPKKIFWRMLKIFLFIQPLWLSLYGQKHWNIFQNIMFHRRKSCSFGNNTRVSKWWQKCLFWVNYPFNFILWLNQTRRNKVTSDKGHLLDSCIIISAGQRLIASKISFCLYNMCVYCVYLLCIYKYTHVQYIFWNIYMY